MNATSPARKRFGKAVLARALALSLFSVTPFSPPSAQAEDGGAPPATREPLEGAKLDATLDAIAKARKDLKTLRASFVQERRITLLATTITSRGELTFAAPDRLRWDLAAPDDIVYFVGPEGLSYRSASSSATVPKAGPNVARGLEDLRALLGGDLAKLRERYVLTGSRGASGDVEIQGAAREKAPIRAFSIALDPKLIVPTRARLYEGKTDRIDLVFSNATVNLPVDPARLRP